MKLITLLLLIRTLVSPIAIEPTKENFYSFTDAMKPAYSELGLADRELYIYYDLMESSGATTFPSFQYNKYCGTKIDINPMHFGNEFIALAHETGHAYQGVACASKTVEAGGTLLSLKALSMTDSLEHKQIFYRYLEQLLEWRIVDELCKKGVQEQYGFDITCSEAYERRPYTKAIDWLLSGETIRVSSLPVPINTKEILVVIRRNLSDSTKSTIIK